MAAARRDAVRPPPDVTPFVLSLLHEQSGGRTLAANRALVTANADLAANVALALAT